jgi:glyoxylase-like metal-dependent hydrolase (beta-lactamase superfamily II)
MKIIMLKKNPFIYSCNAYFVLGSWNRLEDVNTLVDIGQDGYIINEIDEISTGLGKRPVELVVFTHSHFDHMAGLKTIKQKYNPIIYAYTKSDGVHYTLTDGQILRMGDSYFEVIHVPGHSSDSVFLYCQKEKTIFTGDTSLNIRSDDATYEDEFITVIERLTKLEIEVIYSGHDDPITYNAGAIILQTYNNIKRQSRLRRSENHGRGITPVALF